MDQSNNEGKKRLIGTLDPDYSNLPDSKKIKLLQAKGEKEIYDRVVKVVENQFLDAINEKNLEVDEIDERILRTQQSLHTLRYCISLNFYAFGKLHGKLLKEAEINQVCHPTISHHLGHPSTSNESLPTAEALSVTKSIPKDSPCKEAGNDPADNGPKLQKENESQNITAGSSEENCRVISQGRLKRLQKKVRVVIGNTYQYLKDSDGPDDQMKFKWHIYVRGPPEKSNISNYISSITFTLDKSYAPHDVITISKHPFYLSRRGWGEFKIYLNLKFIDSRNKPMQLLHPLTLARVDDPLAFTGLWRLGKEMWYDIWLYDKLDPMEYCDNSESSLSSLKSTEELMKEKGFSSETVYSDTDGNTTMLHRPANEQITSDDYINNDGLTSNSTCLNGRGTELLGNTVVEKDGVNEFSEKKKRIAGKKCLIQKENEINGTLENGREAHKVIDNKGSYVTENENENLGTFKETETHPDKVRNVKRSATDTFTNGDQTVDIKLKSASHLKLPNEIEKPTRINTTQSSVTEKWANNILTESSSMKLPRFTNGTKNEKLCKLFIRQNDGELVAWMVPESMYNMALKFSEKNGRKVSASAQTVPPKSDSKGANTSLPFNGILKRASVPAVPPNGTVTPLTAIPTNPDTPLAAVPTNPCFRILRPPKIGQNVMRQPLLAVRGQSTRVQTPQNVLSTVKVRPSCLAGVPVSNSTVLANGGPKVIKVKNENFIKPDIKNIQNFGVLSTSANIVGSNSIRLIQPNNAKFIQTSGIVDKNIFHFKGNHISLPTYGITNGIAAPLIKKDLNYKVVKMNPSNQSCSVSPILAPVLAPTIEAPRPEKISVDSSISNGGDSSVSNIPIMTRRIFLSAPSHLVKLREATSSHLKGQDEGAKTETVNKSQIQVSPLDEYKRWKISLRTQSERCRSVEEVIRIYMKGLPLFVSQGAEGFDWLPCAPSYKDYIQNAVGTRRALEFWRAREIRRELKLLKIENWKDWNAVRIASWARKHCYTPVENASAYCTLDKRFKRLETSATSTSSFTIFSADKFESSKADEVGGRKRAESNDSIIIVESDDDEDEKATPRLGDKKEEIFQDQNKEEPVLITMPHTTDGSHFVDLCLSKVRLKMEPEEIEPGVKMDAAKLILWRVLLSFMEDLTRSSHAEAVSTPLPPSKFVSNDSSVVTVRAKHILAALSRGRPQFQLLSQYGLGKGINDGNTEQS